MSGLNSKKILIGITGGIAIYKIANLVRRLTLDHGAEVQVVMTKSALEFMTPLIFETFTGKPVLSKMFDRENMVSTRHIDVVQESDIFLVAPATANIVGKTANGIGDDLLSTMLLASKPEKTHFVLAMNKNMYANPIFQSNRNTLISHGYGILEPGVGALATRIEGEGVGRLENEDTIIQYIESYFTKTLPLKGKNILVTGGPTREYIDRVRFISNPSTGKMGLSLAREAMNLGANVKFITGPVTLEIPATLSTIRVTSAEEMKDTVLREYKWADAVFMSAAVEDITPVNTLMQKVKKSNIPDTIPICNTTDILEELGKEKANRILVGFSVETENEIENSIRKIKKKNLDYIVLNNPDEEGAGFGTDTNIVKIINGQENIHSLPKLSKSETSKEIFKIVFSLHM